MPRSFQLEQNYPNPFNPATTIAYDLPVASEVSLTIYNLRGQEVARVVEGWQAAGRYNVRWEGANAASGIYFYRLRAASMQGGGESFTETRKMVLLR